MANEKPFEVRDFEPPQAMGRILSFAFVALVVIFVLAQSFYQVQPEEAGIVLRLGEYVGEMTPPGLHFRLPFVDKVYKVPIQRQLTAELGFLPPGIPFPSRAAEAEAQNQARMEASMLTGDLNAAVVGWVVQYRIVDPYKYLFRVRHVEATFRDMAEAVMREAVGDRTVNEVITVGRQEITIVAFEKLQELCDLYETGIQVDQVVLQDVTPPEDVKDAFNSVNRAEQRKVELINKAQQEYNAVVPKAAGEAQQTILAAEGYALDRVNRALGEATRFEAIYAQYRQAPEVTRQRIYLETLSDILPTVGRKVVVDEDASTGLTLLSLDGVSQLPGVVPKGGNREESGKTGGGT